MKCNNCGSEWNSTIQSDTCPFCGADLKLTAEEKVYTDIQSAVNFVVSKFGKEILQNEKKFFSILSDFTRGIDSEKRLLKLCLESGAVKMLLAADGEKNEEKQAAVLKAANFLENSFYIKKEMSLSALTWVYVSLGWENISTILGNEDELSAPEKLKDSVKVNNNRTSVPVQRGNIALEDGDYEEAALFFEHALDANPSDGEAYLGKFLALNHLKSLADMDDKVFDLGKSKEFRRAQQFADQDLTEVLRRFEQSNNIKIELIRFIDVIKKVQHKKKIYETAVSSMSVAKSEWEYTSCAKLFELIVDFSDSQLRRNKCLELAKLAREQMLYDRAIGMLSAAESEQEVKDAEMLFQSILEYNDSNAKIEECHRRLSEIRNNKTIELQEKKYREACKILENAKAEEDYLFAKGMFLDIYGFKDVDKKIEECNLEIQLLQKQVAIAVEVMNRYYYEGRISVLSEELKNLGVFGGERKKEVKDQILTIQVKLNESRQYFRSLNGTTDAPTMTFDEAQKIIDRLPREARSKLPLTEYYKIQVGSTYKFGKYQWRVLAKENYKLLLITTNCVRISNFSRSDVNSWRGSFVRSWLNDTFYNDAFSANERSRILNTMVVCPDVPENDKQYENDNRGKTKDRIFLLSVNEVFKYFSSDRERVARYKNNPTKWWLRTTFYRDSSYCIRTVNEKGSISSDHVYFYKYMENGIRPAMWIEIN